MRGSLQSYRKVSLDGEIAVASPHKIIQIMLQTALERIAQAKYAIENEDIEKKGIAISKAVGLINGLDHSLNYDSGDIANNLHDLYVFIITALTEVNINNNTKTLDDIAEIIKNIKAGWDGIPIDMRNIEN